jgi:hypothetical protein
MHMASHPLKALAVSATLLALAAPAARAQEARAAIGEAAAVHALATAARLCNLISEPELTRALSRMDRVNPGERRPGRRPHAGPGERVDLAAAELSRRR